MENNLAVNAIRILSADMVQKANSGHPGMPLGSAPIIYELWANHMNHNPADPGWINRDRFVLSAGHASSMLYSMLHLYGYEGMTLNELKRFRQLGSLTPGHPEYGHTVGVEATTGPLGAGLGMAVGMALAQAHMAALFNTEEYKMIDHYTFVLCGDGCMMEGISSEVMSLAGTLGLGKLIVLYDSNDITIEGSTDLAFREDVCKRYEAFGFQVQEVPDGTDTAAIGAAIESAKNDGTRPSLIRIKTTIGYGGGDRQGKASAHGEPLGEENVARLRQALGWKDGEAFHIPEEVYGHYAKLAKKGADKEAAWKKRYEAYCSDHKELGKMLVTYLAGDMRDYLDSEEFWTYEKTAAATRSASGKILNQAAARFHYIFGGSADLGPSNKTAILNGGDFGRDNYRGRNLHYGVREIGMTAIANGILLHGGLKTFVATFFVFADYMKPMLRLSSLMKLPLISIFTHDSIGVGEDGPTHEPVEQLSMLRAQPNIHVFRPADEGETRAAWYLALTEKETPTCLVLSRQELPVLENTGRQALRGGYILRKETGVRPELVILATGSEVALAIEAAPVLEKKGISTRIVSMPCLELFQEQTPEYRRSVLGEGKRRLAVIEAASSQSWGKLLGPDGIYLCIDTFGASAPAPQLFDKYNLTVKKIVDTILMCYN